MERALLLCNDGFFFLPTSLPIVRETPCDSISTPQLDRRAVCGEPPSLWAESPAGAFVAPPTASRRRCRVGGGAWKTPAPCRLAKEGRHAYARLRPRLLAGVHEECREHHGVRMDVKMALLLREMGYSN